MEKYKGKLAGKVVLMPATQTYEIEFEPLASRITEEELEKIDNMEETPKPSNKSKNKKSGKKVNKRKAKKQKGKGGK